MKHGAGVPLARELGEPAPSLFLTAPLATSHVPPPQSAREKASAQFRTARSAIMFSSDVSARGVDYPDVTMVLQVGWCCGVVGLGGSGWVGG